MCNSYDCIIYVCNIGVCDINHCRNSYKVNAWLLLLSCLVTQKAFTIQQWYYYSRTFKVYGCGHYKNLNFQNVSLYWVFTNLVLNVLLVII